ncbi:MAG: DUF4136 domain-containing protein [Gammaproteobacteria bacterium]|nr:MAG: DUF4136 domain-containing protein [Gammaproteobacteria bacterium]
MKKYLFIITLAIISGCSSLSVTTDYDEKIDFSNFKTYYWHADNDHNAASVKYLDHIVDQRIRSAIDSQLLSQGYTKVSTETKHVDFLVNYSIVVDDRVDIRTYNNYNGMYPGYSYRAGYGYYGGGYGVAYSTGSETQVTHYKQGTLIIDIVSPQTDKLIWRGSADGRLPKGTDRKERDELAQEYVSSILSKFPPED